MSRISVKLCVVCTMVCEQLESTETKIYSVAATKRINKKVLQSKLEKPIPT
jgi:hypothetical protein